MKHSTGFTLIELLVVITIIAILSSVVLQRVDLARERGVEARVTASMDSFYKNGVSEEIEAGDFNVVCGQNGVATSSKLLTVVSSIRENTDLFECNSTVTAFAASAQLDATTYWCVDSTGSQGETVAALGGATVCP